MEKFKTIEQNKSEMQIGWSKPIKFPKLKDKKTAPIKKRLV